MPYSKLFTYVEGKTIALYDILSILSSWLEYTLIIMTTSNIPLFQELVNR